MRFRQLLTLSLLSVAFSPDQPIVDGPLSVTSYVHAVDKAYESYRTKYEKKFAAAKTNGVNGHANGATTNGHSQSHGITAASFDYVLFHS